MDPTNVSVKVIHGQEHLRRLHYTALFTQSVYWCDGFPGKQHTNQTPSIVEDSYFLPSTFTFNQLLLTEKYAEIMYDT